MFVAVIKRRIVVNDAGVFRILIYEIGLINTPLVPLMRLSLVIGIRCWLNVSTSCATPSMTDDMIELLVSVFVLTTVSSVWVGHRYTCWEESLVHVRHFIMFLLDHSSNNDLLTHWGRYKMANISRQHFQMHFLEWKYMNFDWYFTEVCF